MAKRIGPAVLLALLATTPAAAVGCEWFGTQLDCSFGATDVVIGTQTSEAPRHASSFAPSPFHGNGRLMEEGTWSARRWRVELQAIGKDPRLCRDLNGERYCY